MTKPTTLTDILTNASYTIENKHRGYIWDESNIIQLTKDTHNLLYWNEIKPNKPQHYMGTIILRSINQPTAQKPVYEIIDGVQRLLNLSIYLSFILHKLLEHTDNENEQNTYHNQIESLLYSDNKPNIKLDTTENTQKYLDLLKNHRFNIPDDDEYPYITRLIRNADYYQSMHIPKNQLRKILNIITTQFTFTTYEVQDEFEAEITAISQTNRGKTYSELDILKNYLFLWITNNIQDQNEKAELTTRINQIWKEIYDKYETTHRHTDNLSWDKNRQTYEKLNYLVQHIYITHINQIQNSNLDEDAIWWRSWLAIEHTLPLVEPNDQDRYIYEKRLEKNKLTFLHLLQTIEAESNK